MSEDIKYVADESKVVLTAPKLRTMRSEDNQLWRVSLDAAKGNILDSVMVAGLTKVFELAAADPRLKAVLITAEGDDFCYGASVEEHQAEQVRGMLKSFHGLFRAMAAASVPVIAAVRGHCLGGGLELASFCSRIFAHPEAKFGQPEIKLGVFAPVASVVLPLRMGQAAAESLLLTGRTISATKAHAMGLVDSIKDTPEAAAMDWITKRFLPHSACSLRMATRAARMDYMRRFNRDIEELERIYLEELMATPDANEGIAAFLEKRAPDWSKA